MDLVQDDQSILVPREVELRISQLCAIRRKLEIEIEWAVSGPRRDSTRASSFPLALGQAKQHRGRPQELKKQGFRATLNHTLQLFHAMEDLQCTDMNLV